VSLDRLHCVFYFPSRGVGCAELSDHRSFVLVCRRDGALGIGGGCAVPPFCEGPERVGCLLELIECGA